MSLNELKLIYERCYRVANRELAMRRRVLINRPDYQDKLNEMQQMLTDLTTLKDELKRRIEAETITVGQMTLIDVPRRVEYR